MTSNIYDYTGIVSLKGYSNESVPMEIFESKEGEIETLVNGVAFSKFIASAIVGKVLFATLYEAQTKSKSLLTITKPNGVVIDCGAGDIISSAQENLYYTIDYEWVLSEPLVLDVNGVNQINVEYVLLR